MNGKTINISIVTPSYNSVAFVEKTIKSVISQNYPYLEYIIYDAGSTDGSRDIITKYARKYKQIKTVFEKDRGQWDAINKGFHMATGKLLAYINADDIYEKNTLFRAAEAYNQHPDRLWYAGYGRMIDDAGRVTQEIFSLYKNLLLSVNSRTGLYIVNYLMQPSVFITKKAFLKIGDFIGREKYIMEYDSWLRLSQIEMPVVIRHNLSYFRLTTGGASLSYTRKILEADQNIVAGYTRNDLLLKLHNIHNSVRFYLQRTI